MDEHNVLAFLHAAGEPIDPRNGSNEVTRNFLIWVQEQADAGVPINVIILMGKERLAKELDWHAPLS